MPSPKWTSEEDAALRAGVAAGQTFQEIGHALGRTKNMISGRATRLGLRQPGTLRGGQVAAPPGYEPSGCRYIAGEPDWLRRGDRIYCGAPVAGRSRYCAEHRRRVWLPPRADPPVVASPRPPP